MKREGLAKQGFVSSRERGQKQIGTEGWGPKDWEKTAAGKGGQNRQTQGRGNCGNWTGGNVQESFAGACLLGGHCLRSKKKKKLRGKGGRRGGEVLGKARHLVKLQVESEKSTRRVVWERKITGCAKVEDLGKHGPTLSNGPRFKGGEPKGKLKKDTSTGLSLGWSWGKPERWGKGNHQEPPPPPQHPHKKPPLVGGWWWCVIVWLVLVVVCLVFFGFFCPAQPTDQPPPPAGGGVCQRGQLGENQGRENGPRHERG